MNAPKTPEMIPIAMPSKKHPKMLQMVTSTNTTTDTPQLAGIRSSAASA